MDKRKQLGQYFTPDFVADFMVGLSSQPGSAKVLEPSSGEGVFLDALKKQGYTDVVGYELDESLLTENTHKVVNESFISAEYPKPFDLIIGNPPYVRWKNMAAQQKAELSMNQLWNTHFNSLSDYLYIFILKSVELLKDGGELIFITPEYWLGTMHSQSLRDYLVKHGYIESVYHFSETPIFDKVASSIIIFKFVKSQSSSKRKQPVQVYSYSSRQKLVPEDLVRIGENENWTNFTTDQFQTNESWILAPKSIKHELIDYERRCSVRFDEYHLPTLIPEEEVPYVRLGDIAVIANGMVSGLDKAFQLPAGAKLNDHEVRATIEVIKAKNIAPLQNNSSFRYIYLNDTDIDEKTLKKSYPYFYKQLKPHKEKLLERYDYKRHTPHWDWIFLRSLSLFQQDRQKLLVPCKERITNKDHLRFCVAEPMQFPTQDVTAIYLNKDIREDIRYIMALLCSNVTYDWVKYKGLIKGGIAEFSERPLSSIPIRLIDWYDSADVARHDAVVEFVKSYDGRGGLEELDRLVAELLQ